MEVKRTMKSRMIRSMAAATMLAAMILGAPCQSALAQTYSAAEIGETAEAGKKKNEWVVEPHISDRYIEEPFSRPQGQAESGKVEFSFGTSPDGPFVSEQPTDEGHYYMLASIKGTDEYEGISSITEFSVLRHLLLEYPTWYIRKYMGEPQTMHLSFCASALAWMLMLLSERMFDRLSRSVLP